MIDYNLEECIRSLVFIGKSIYPSFTIDSHNSDFYINLIKYQFNDPTCEFDLSKGLYLHGNIGVGKTLSMRLFEKSLNNRVFPRRHKIISCREVQFSFNKDGQEGISKYGYESFSQLYNGYGCSFDKSKPLIFCFDDLGAEDLSAKFYGQTTNVMAEIILSRYEMFQKYNMITHFTSNLTASDLTRIYGDRNVSRLKEMVNDVVLGGEDRRC
jgi:DNA replication protein DnaC